MRPRLERLAAEVGWRTYRCTQCGNTAAVAPRAILDDVVTFDVPYCAATPACAENPLEMARTTSRPRAFPLEGVVR